MYAGNNKLALDSQKRIAEALLSLLKDYQFNNICISLICKEANISRQTFYSLFDSKEDVIIFALGEEACYEPDKKKEDCSCVNYLSEDFSHYLIKHKDLLTMLMNNGIMHLFLDMQYHNFYDCEEFMKGKSDEERSYAASYLAGAFTGIAKNYKRYTCKHTQKELKDITLCLLKGNLFNKE